MKPDGKTMPGEYGLRPVARYRPSSMNDKRGNVTARCSMRCGSTTGFGCFGVGAGFTGFGAAACCGFGSLAARTNVDPGLRSPNVERA